MKTFHLILIATVFFSFANNAENNKTIKSKPEKVIVFTQGAQVFRSAEVTLTQGMNTIVFDGLERTIDQGSIQLSGKGNFVISETQLVVIYPEFEKEKAGGDIRLIKMMKSINDSLELLSFQKKEITNQLEVLSLEKTILMSYKLFKGQSTKDSLLLLKDGLTYFHEKLSSIFGEVLRKDQALFKVNSKINELNQRLSLIYQDQGTLVSAKNEQLPDYRVMVSLIAENSCNAKLNLNYMVTEASWTPFYDLRTDGVETNVKLTYKAMIQQVTGNDWKDVKLVLSTGNPQRFIDLPELNTWYLDYHAAVYKRKMTLNKLEDRREGVLYEQAAAEPSSRSGYEEYKDASTAAEYVQMTDHTVQAEFEISLPYSIPSDNKKHIVSVMSKELNTKYVYKAIPKLDVSAFLTARVTGWEDLNLLPGQANIFFEGSFVGETYIQAENTTDTLTLSMGRDAGVQLKRSKVKDKSKDKIVDNAKLYQFAYEIVIRNGKAKTIEIEVQDQIPLSRDKSIIVEKQDISDSNFNEANGVLTWRAFVKSKDSKKLHFAYTVKAPKDLPIAIR